VSLKHYIREQIQHKQDTKEMFGGKLQVLLTLHFVKFLDPEPMRTSEMTARSN
jgi:hypothetical protein